MNGITVEVAVKIGNCEFVSRETIPAEVLSGHDFPQAVAAVLMREQFDEAKTKAETMLRKQIDVMPPLITRGMTIPCRVYLSPDYRK